MAPLKLLRFRSNNAGDASVLADYLRSFGYLLTDEAHVEGDHEDGPELRVTWAHSAASLALTWREGGDAWSHGEEIRIADFAETAENRRRRALRLAFHHLLEKEAGLRDSMQSTPSPWGILTGVRPTKMLQRFFDQKLEDGDIRSILAEDFGVSPDRIRLLLDVAHRQRPFLPAPDEGRKRISLYLGYPFCPSRCGYCSFAGYEFKRWRKWQDAYHHALEKEIKETGGAASRLGFQVENLYFGGGTPTCMPPSAMDKLLSAVRESFAVMPDTEWTVEGGRPETLTGEMLDVLAAHPVNRICVNPQSMNQGALDRIGRRHEASAVTEAIAAIREMAAGLGRDWRINCDLILGLPGEGAAEVEDSLRQALDLRPDNLTLHGLAIKRGSAYKEQNESLPDRLTGLEMIRLSRDMLEEAGYQPYYLYRQKDSLAGGENTGYCLPGKECRYNILMIEERQTILGLGAGAGSKFLRPGDWSLINLYNPKDMIQYITGIDEFIRRKVDKLAMTD